MSGIRRAIGWLEDKSDVLSPLVVKEVRQVVRGREFLLSFAVSLVAGLVVAFVGATDALAGKSMSGRWTFASLMGCLGFLGLAVVPLGAFNALRNERMEQTLELITLTALSSRRIVVGKLLAQVVKLATLFAAIAPFIAMSFLLGGIDFVTILVSLVVLFMGSVWAGALCLFLSSTFKSRAMSGLMFAAVGLMVLFLLIVGSNVFSAASRGLPGPLAFGVSGTGLWWGLAIATSFWLASLVNFVLLSENRLSLPTEDTVTPLRIGFFVQFLLIVAWTLAYLKDPARASVAEVLGIAGSWHLAVVAYFAMAEDMAVPRRVLSRLTSASPWRWWLVMFGPGGGRAAAYILAQMVMLIGAFWVLEPSATDRRWLLAICGYLCFFVGVPTLAYWMAAPARVTPLRLRVAVLVLVAAAMVVPDILHYAVYQPEIIDLDYGARHLVNPLVTIANWRIVEARGWSAWPMAIGLVGLVACLALVFRGVRPTGRTFHTGPHQPTSVGGDPGSGRVLN